MKKNYITTLLILFCCFLTQFVTAQVNKTTEIKIKEEPSKQTTVTKYPVGDKSVTQKNTPVAGTATYLNEDDKYQGREKEILNNLIIQMIPENFPKYQKGKGIEWYNTEIDNYYRSNPVILKESVRAKLGV